MDDGKWLYCPKCKKKTRVKVYENPKTGDIIIISVISSVIALIGIVVTTRILNQKKKEIYQLKIL